MSETGPEFTPIVPVSDNGNLIPIIESESVQNPEDSKPESAPKDANLDTELDYNMTIGGPDYIENKLNPSRYAKEQALVAHMDAVRQKLEASPLAVAEVRAPESQPEANTTITPEDLNTYTEALNYDMTNPEDAKFTPEQIKNIEIMEALEVKYPHAFAEKTTKDGKKYLVLKTLASSSVVDVSKDKNLYQDEGTQKSYIFSEKGLTQAAQAKTLGMFNYLEKFDLEPVLEAENTTQNKHSNINITNENGDRASVICVNHMGYENVDLGLLKVYINDAEYEFKARAEAKKQLTTEEILSAL